jgi:HEAT repeat protein
MTCRRQLRAHACWALFLAVALAPARSYGLPPPDGIGPILAEMAERGTQFRAEKLHAMGLEGLSAVLDWFLPGTAEPKTAEPPDGRVAELIAQLGDESFRVREAATQKIHRLGIVAQAALVEATRSSDAEIAWRAVRILRAWETERNQDVNRYTTGLNVYLSGITDEPRLQELARRSKLVLDAGLPAAPGRQHVVRLCILALARTGKDQYTDGLKPLLKHRERRVATFVTQAVAAGVAADGHYPAILLDALESEHQDIALTALNSVTAGTDAQQADELKRRLHALLKGNDETLKLQACRPLIAQFHDAEALDYVRTLLNGPKQELARKHQAIGVLGDPRAVGKTIDPKVLELLLSLIKSNETNLRLPAVNALANHAGEDVVRALIPLLGDPLSSVSRAAVRGLQTQTDRKMVRGLLADAAKDGQNEKVKQQAATLIKQFDATPMPPAGSRATRGIRPPMPPIMLDEEVDDIFQ